jgi:AAA+ superfamily predicted ATPase
MALPYLNHLEHLRHELAWLDLVLRHAIGRARSGRDQWAGLCISDEGVDKLTEPPGNGDDVAEPAEGELLSAIESHKAAIAARVGASLDRGVPLPLPRLARLFGLSPFEQDVLLLCLAPELDLKYERLYAYLHDDATRRVLSIDVVLRLLCRTAEERVTARDSFLPGNRLRRYCLVDILTSNPEPPLLARSLRIDARIAEHLMGSTRIDGWLGSSLRLVPAPEDPALAAPEQPTPLLQALEQYLNHAQSEPWVAALHGPDRLERERTARALCAAASLPLLVADLDVLAGLDLPFETAVRSVFREAALHSAALYFEEGDVLHADDDKPRVRSRHFAAALVDMGWITFVSARTAWDPPDALKRRWSFSAEFPVPAYNERRRLWKTALDGQAADGVDVGELAARFRFTTAGVLNSVSGARNQARMRGDGIGPLSQGDVQAACRAESSRGLQRYARRIATSYTWDDLVLSAEAKQQLHEIVEFIRHRESITAAWGFGAKHALGKGTNVLFTGPSGTGKTMAVGIIAAELGLDLYKVDLSTVVSKYIGETEKNLNRVFQEAETANAVLFFDEADALFGRRSEVKDSHDRYANIEVNYLLQKMEEHEGIVVLATNMSKNMDEAFVRRLQFTVIFPFPEEAERLRIWQRVFPVAAPLDHDVRFEFLARRMKVAGGNIKNIALGAALLARVDGGAIGMRHLVLSAKREFQKMGKICARADFGEYYELVG